MGLEAIVVQLRRRRGIIAVFRDQAAESPEMARSLEELGLRDSMLLRKMMRQQVIRREHGRYYLDDRGLITHRMNRVKWGMIVLFMILGLVILYMNRS